MTEKKAPPAVDIWKELRKPFPKGVVGLLPKLTCSDCSKKNCVKHRKEKCRQCDNYISTAHMHLDYVGHAAVTDRLNNIASVDSWTWEFVAIDESGNPKLDNEGNLWIKLTIHEVTRLGVGDGKNMKERIGDALRNAAMRFGIALDLWTKDELESTLEDPSAANSKPTEMLDEPTGAQIIRIKALCGTLGVYDETRESLLSQVTTQRKADEMILALEEKVAAKKEPRVENVDN